MAVPRSIPLNNAELAPFAVLRTAGISVDLFRTFFRGALAAPFADAKCEQEMLEQLRPDLEALLHRWVGELGEDKLRHKILDLRRAVHNGRFVDHAKHEPLLARACAAGGPLKERLEQWFSAARRLNAALSRVAATDQFLDSEDFARSLLPLFDHGTFAKGVSHASWTLFAIRDKLASGTLKAGRRSRLVNAVLSYLVRAGTKTSPLTTFMQCSLLDFELSRRESSIDLSEARIEAVSSLNRGIFAQVREARLQAMTGDADWPMWRNPTLRIEDGLATWWQPEFNNHDGRIWKSHRLEKLHLGTVVARSIAALDAATTVGSLRRTLVAAGVPSDQANASIRALVTRRILVLAPPSDPTEQSVAKHIRSWMSESGSGEPDELLTTLGRADAAAASFAQASLADRVRISEAVAGDMAAVVTDLGLGDFPKLGGPIMENSWWRGGQGLLGQDFVTQIERISGLILRTLKVSKSYLWLRARFIESYGAGGVCTDLVPFLNKVGALFPSSPMTLTAEEASMPLDLRGVKIPFSFRVQFLPSTSTTASGKDAVAVIRVIDERGIWHLSRYTVDPADADLKRRCRDWLEYCAGPEEPVALLYGADSVTLQNHGQLTERMIDLDRVDAAPNWLRAADLQLAHDQHTGRLICRDQSGKAIRPFYLGGTLPAPDFGPAFFLNLIGELIEPVGARAAASQPSSTKLPDRPLFYRPRLSMDGCILAPAAWYIKTSDLRAELHAHNDATRAFLLWDFFGRRRIAQEGLAFGQSARPAPHDTPQLERLSQPMWFSVDESWCMRRLLRIVEEFDHLVVIEAVPRLDDNSASIGGEPYVSEYHIEAAFTFPETPAAPKP